MCIASAIIEQTLLIGVIFRILEEKLGSYFSLFIFAFVVVVIHISNPNSSLNAGIRYASQAVLLLGAA